MSVIDLELVYVTETGSALIVSDDEDNLTFPNIVLPKGEIEFTPAERGDKIIVTLPEWLAANEGLI